MIKVILLTTLLLLSSSADWSFTVVGDFGLVEDLSYAKKLFTAIDDYSQDNPFEFFVTVGDNVYPNGITTDDDSGLDVTLRELFQKPNIKNKPIHATLGNHDCYGDADAMVDYTLYNWDMQHDFWYTFYDEQGSPSEDNCQVGMFFLNGCKLSCRGRAGTGPCLDMKVMTEEEVDIHFTWMDYFLKKARRECKWVVTFNHYQMHSVDRNGDRGDSVHDILPVVIEAGVDVFFMGHSHNMQYLTYTPPEVIGAAPFFGDSDCQQEAEFKYKDVDFVETVQGECMHEALVGASGMPSTGEESMEPVCEHPSTAADAWYAFNDRRAYARVEVSDDLFEIIFLDDENQELFRGRIRTKESRAE